MDIWNRYVSPSGYHMNDDGTDSLGVDHSNFSLRDEIAYQMNRVNNEEHQQSMLPQVNTTMGQTTTPWNNKNQIPTPLQTVQTSMPQSQAFSYRNDGINNAPSFGTSNHVNPSGVMIEQQGNNMLENNNSIIQSINTHNPINIGYNMGQRIGEFAADTKLAYDYWKKMNQVGAKLINTLGPGAGADIDNYYHPLLQCELAKIGQQSRDNGIALGYAKEYLMDYPIKKFWQRKSHNEIMKDSRKDLQNNLYGSNLGYNNSNKSCEDLLDDRRTPNMRKLGIR